MPEKNLCARTRQVNQPYEVWAMSGWVFQVLKKYQTPSKEQSSIYSRWLVAVKSPYETDRAGHDSYVKDIKSTAVLVWQEGNENLNNGATELPEQYKF